MNIKYNNVLIGGLCQERYITNEQIEDFVRTNPQVVEIEIVDDLPVFSEIDFDINLVERVYQNSNEIKNDKEHDLENLTVEYNGLVFDANEISQERINRTIASLEIGDTVEWILADNTSSNVNKEVLSNVLSLATKKQSEIWNKYHLIRNDI